MLQSKGLSLIFQYIPSKFYISVINLVYFHKEFAVESGMY